MRFVHRLQRHDGGDQYDQSMNLNSTGTEPKHRSDHEYQQHSNRGLHYHRDDYSNHMDYRHDGIEEQEDVDGIGMTHLIELLRRIPIICLEDSLLHPSYPIIIWLMIACSHDYVPHRFLLDVCVLFMHDISICNYRDSSTASIDSNYQVPCRSSFNHSMHTNKSSSINSHDSYNAVDNRSGGGDCQGDALKHWMDISNPAIRTLLVAIAMRGITSLDL